AEDTRSGIGNRESKLLYPRTSSAFQMAQLSTISRHLRFPIPESLFPLLLVAVTASCERLAFARPRTDFDGEKAMTYVRAQVALGPRPPGTPAHEKTADWIKIGRAHV